MYRVGQLNGGSLDELVKAVRLELERLALQLSQPVEYAALTTVYAVPGRVFEGQILKADGTTWDPGYGAGPYIYQGSAWLPMFGQGGVTESFVVPISDQTTALTTGQKMTWRMPYEFTLTAVRASVNTAQASGAILTFDLKESGTSVLSTLITIDNTEKTSLTASAQPVISDALIANDAELTFHITQVDGSTAAKGAVMYLIGHQ